MPGDVGWVSLGLAQEVAFVISNAVFGGICTALLQSFQCFIVCNIQLVDTLELSSLGFLELLCCIFPASFSIPSLPSCVPFFSNHETSRVGFLITFSTQHSIYSNISRHWFTVFSLLMYHVSCCLYLELSPQLSMFPTWPLYKLPVFHFLPKSHCLYTVFPNWCGVPQFLPVTHQPRTGYLSIHNIPIQGSVS